MLQNPRTWRSSMSLTVRLVLPFGALVLLSMIFLASRSVDPSQAVALAELDIEELTREPRIGTARFATVTTDDMAVVIDAKTVRSPANPQPGDPVRLMLEDPDGVAEFGIDSQVLFRSDHGQLDQMTNLLTMTGAVQLQDENGYVVNMEMLEAFMDRSRLEGTGGIHGHGPPGEITSQSLTITPLQSGENGYLLDFIGDVRLLYIPTE